MQKIDFLKKAIWPGVISLCVLVVFMVGLRLYIEHLYLPGKLCLLTAKTGISVHYDNMDLFLNGAVLHNVSFHYRDDRKPFAKTAKVKVYLFGRKATIQHLQIERPNIVAAAKIKLDAANKLFALEVSMPPTSCDAFIHGFPEQFTSAILPAKLDGKLAIDLEMRLDLVDANNSYVDGALDIDCEIVQYGALPLPQKFRTAFTHTVYDRNKKKYPHQTGPGSGNWVAHENINRYLRLAVVEAEDPYFYFHKGVLLSRIITAAQVNIKLKKKRYGASTITMQLAKNLFLSRDKTYERKAQELFFVWYLESQFTKSEILTLYLNIAEFGPSIYGIKAAANYYFGTRPDALTLRQSVFLAKLLPSPVKRHKDFLNGEVSADQAKKIRALLARMVANRRITQAEHDSALAEKITFSAAHSAMHKPVSAEIAPVSVKRIAPVSRPRLRKASPVVENLISDRQ